MNAYEAYQKIEKSASILAWGWILNNILGTLSIVVMIYFIWARWHLGLLGVPVLVLGIGLINSVILPFLFRIINKPFAENARSGAVRLAALGVIDETLIQKLTDTKVEYWPKTIVQNMDDKNLDKILNKPRD